MNTSELKLLVEQGEREQALKIVKEFHNVSLKEADEYLDSILQKDEAEIKTNEKKAHNWNIAIIIATLLLAVIIAILVFWLGLSQHRQEGYEKIYSEQSNNEKSTPSTQKNKEEYPQNVIEQSVIEPIVTEKATEIPIEKFSVKKRVVSEIKDVVSKAEYVVTITQKYNDKQLDNIADYLAKTDVDKLKYVFVSFYLEGMNLSGPNYGISKRTPDITSTQINYVEPVKENPQKAPYYNHTVIGKWSMAGGAITVIYKKEAAYYIVDQYSKDDYSDPQKLIRLTVSGRVAFKYIEDTGETFVVMPDGLYGYMEGDLAAIFHNL